MYQELYHFDSTRLEHVRLSRIKIGLIGLGLSAIGVLIGFGLAYSRSIDPAEPEYDELIMMINDRENELVTPVAVYEYMQEVGIKYPEIVWSQVALETGFKSDIFLENSNLFGMKRAAHRPNVQEGVGRGHATYLNWKMSVIDYAIWQASTGVWKFKNEAAYFNYLGAKYAEDPQYVYKVKEIRDNFNSNLETYDRRFTGDTATVLRASLN